MNEKVALLDSINESAHDVFEQRGFEVVTFPRSVGEDELADIASEVSLLGVRSSPEISPEVIEAGGQTLQAIGVYGTGTNHIATAAAAEIGVPVFKGRYENTRSVAELVEGFASALVRRIPEHSMNLHNGFWSKTDKDSRLLKGKVMGVVGYGFVGSQVSEMAEDKGMDVVFYDKFEQLPRGNAERLDSMDDVLKAADIVTLHVPGGGENHHLMNADRLNTMKPGSYLINAARGDLVDLNALREAIESGHLRGAAIDVFEDEPSAYGDEFHCVLQGLKNVILTPHIGGSTIEAQTEIGKAVSGKLVTFMSTGRTYEAHEDIPRLSIDPVERGKTRILNFHKNQPGAEQQIKDIATENGFINQSESTLRTAGKVGGIAVDVEGELTNDQVARIASLDISIRTRVIRNSN